MIASDPDGAPIERILAEIADYHVRVGRRKFSVPTRRPALETLES